MAQSVQNPITEFEATSDQRVPVLERALFILEHLLNHPNGLGVSDITHQLGYPKNSVYRIVHTLERFGYVYRDPETKRFVLSRKMFSMAYKGTEERTLMEFALPVMRDMRDAVKETVLLSIVSDNEGLVLEQVPGLHSFRFVVEPGTRRSVHGSSHGKAILAFMEEDQRDEESPHLLNVWHSNCISQKPVDFNRIPKFKERDAALKETINESGLLVFALIFSTILVFLLTYASFLRCDIR